MIVYCRYDRIGKRTRIEPSFSGFTGDSLYKKGLTSGEDNRCPLHFYIQSDENSFLKVVKVPKTKGIALDEFNEIISRFQFGVGIG